MKAKFEKKYITLENGIRFVRRADEADQRFIQRVREVVESDYCDELDLDGVSVIEPEPEPQIIEEPEPKLPTEYDNTGKFCYFTKRLTGEVISGKIIWVYLDKRKDLLYYRVKESTGKLHIIRTNNNTLKIIS